MYAMVGEVTTFAPVSAAGLRRTKDSSLRSLRSALFCWVLCLCTVLCSWSAPATAGEIDWTTILELQLHPEDTNTVPPKVIIAKCSKGIAAKGKVAKEQLASLYSVRAGAYNTLEEFEKARNDCEAALKLNPDDVGIRARLGNALHGLGRYDEAIGEFQQVIKQYPKEPNSYEWVAKCYLSKGDFDACIKAGTKAITLDRRSAFAYCVRGIAYGKERQVIKSLNDLDQCIAYGFAPGMSLATIPYFQRGKVWLILGKPSQAVVDFVFAEQLNPGDKARARALEAMAYFACGHYRLVKTILEEDLKAPGPGEAAEVSFLVRAAFLTEKNRLKEALDVAEEARNAYPDEEIMYWVRGNVLLAFGQYAAASADYNEGLDLNSVEMHLCAAKAYLLATCPVGQYRDGGTALKLASDLCRDTDEQNGRLLMLKAMAHAECAQFSKAVKAAEKALKSNLPDCHLREEYEKRLKLFKEGKPYRFDPAAKVFDYFMF